MRLAEPVRLAEGQVAAAAAVLVRAFANDTFFTHALADPVERERLMPPFMTAWTRYGLLFGEVYVTQETGFGLPRFSVVQPKRSNAPSTTQVGK